MNHLHGKRILITRPESEHDTLSERLAAAGAAPVAFPTTTLQVDTEQLALLEQSLRKLSTYDWVIFTSQNAVRLFWQQFQRQNAPDDFPGGLRIAAVGPATALALQQRGLQPEVVPDVYSGEEIASKMGDVRGKSILLPRAHGARPILVEELARKGAHIDEMRLYRSVTNRAELLNWAELDKGVDYVIFTSPSTVRSFFELLGERAAAMLSTAVIACIGPVTAGALAAFGFEAHLVAREYTGEGLVKAILAHQAERE